MSQTVPMSRFVQNYKQHLADAETTEERIVLSQRAGGQAWVLEPASRATATDTATDFLSNALRVIVHDDVLLQRFTRELTESLPWTIFLSEAGRTEFTIEAADVLRACASLGRFTAFAALLDEWRNTADIMSDPKLSAALTTPVDAPLDIPVAA